MNDSIGTSCSAWKVKWLPNRTEADQGTKREGVYISLESEQFVWMYYQQRHPLGGADSESNKSSKRESSENLIQIVWRREDGIEISPESEKMAEHIPTKLKKRAGKCTVMEPEAVSKTNNALQKAVVKTHLWKKSTGRRKTCKCERA